MARQLTDPAGPAVLGVGGRDRTSAMEDFVERHSLGSIEHLADPDGEIWARFGVRGQPTWIFVDGETGNGEIVFGALGAEGIRSELEKLAAS